MSSVFNKYYFFVFCLFQFRIKVQRERYVHRLIISSTRMSDAGQYSVVAGGNMSTANLHVEGRDVRITSLRKEIEVFILKIISYIIQKFKKC